MPHELPYIAAIVEAIQLEMERDDSVLYFGQNMATTENEPFVDAFGKDRVRQTGVALGLFALACLFLANVLFVVAARTALVVIAVLLVLFALRQFGWKGALGVLLVALTLVAIGWATSPNLRARVTVVAEEFQRYQVDNARTSTPLACARSAKPWSSTAR